jgi:hypothetical protein
MSRKTLLICVVCFVLMLDIEASTIRDSIMDNLNSGLKMLGKNDRRLIITHPSYINRLPSGVSSKVADLVSQSFAPAKIQGGKRVNFRQDAIVIGEELRPSSENSLMGGMLKLLGLDGSQIGAAAMNGLIFIAQMVRYGANRVMGFMMDQTADLYKIVDYIHERVVTTDPALPPPIPSGRIVVPLNGQILVYNRV